MVYSLLRAAFAAARAAGDGTRIAPCGAVGQM
jgi:hypothetical protein